MAPIGTGPRRIQRLACSTDQKRANFEYYEARTLHTSSLSPSIHAIIGIEVGDTTRAVQYFERSVLVDLTDTEGIRFRTRWRGPPIHVAIDHSGVELRLGGDAGGTEDVVMNGKPVRLTSGRPVEVSR
jgi:kojibiose phosphorylase